MHNFLWRCFQLTVFIATSFWLIWLDNPDINSNGYLIWLISILAACFATLFLSKIIDVWRSLHRRQAANQSFRRVAK
jgi:hypothetical protein